MIVERNRDVILGIKARIDPSTTRGTGIEPLRRARALADRLWLPPSLCAHLAQQCDAALALLDGLAQRLAEARAGFAVLPRDEADDPAACAPAPVPLSAAA